MQETITFPTLQGSSAGAAASRFTFPELLYKEAGWCSEWSSSTSTPFVSAPSSPTRGGTAYLKGFYFSAPTSPSCPLSPQFDHQGSSFHFPATPADSSCTYTSPSISHPALPNSPLSSLPLHPPLLHASPQAPQLSFPIPDSSRGSIRPSWPHQTVPLQRSSHVNGHTIYSETEHHHGRSIKGSYNSLQADQSRSSTWTQQTLKYQADQHHSSSRGSSPCSHKSLQVTHHDRSSSWAPESLQTEHHESYPLPQKSYQTEYERGSNWAQHSPQTHHERSSSWAQQKSRQQEASLSQKDLQTEHARNPLGSQASSQIKDSHARTQNPLSNITDSTNHKALKRLQVEDTDASYSRKSFYASAVPFSWEEKPGTPKARSIASEASYGEDDSPSNLLSGSSEFEFSARFSELEDPPMSPTPISSTFHSFKHQYAYGSPSPTHKYTDYTNPDMQTKTVNEEQIWPLRPPPRLDSPILQKQFIKDERNELKHSYGSLATLSAPQSPRSPRIFDIRGAFCGILSPVDAVFDPFLAAMEKSMAKSGDDLANDELGKGPKKKTNRHGNHRRTQSLSPLRVFHWDDHSAKSNSSSNGSSSMDEVKNKHPIQREINARHSAGTPKGSKRWSLKGFLHRKSVSGGETARHSNTSASLRSSGRESCSSSGMGEGPMDVSSVDENMKILGGANSPININPSMLTSMQSTPTSVLSPSSSDNSNRGKLNTNKSTKGPYALHYSMQRAHTEELRKKTFLPYKQGLLGCLGLSSKSYRALATLSKPLQSVS